MRLLAIAALIGALASGCASASVCSAAPADATPRWTLDHYVYDASLKRDWAVLIDCGHPAAPARMSLGSNAASGLQSSKRTARNHPGDLAPIMVKAGTAVEVSNSINAHATLRLSGIAMQTAFLGQPIRIQLAASGRFITALVRGSHSVEMASSAKPLWRAQ
jgi:hypothetical protein